MPRASLILLVTLGLAAAPVALAQKRTAPAKTGRVAVLQRLEQSVSRILENPGLNQKQKSTLEKSRDTFRRAAEARRQGLNEDRKATEKALDDVGKIVRDKKLALSPEDRRAMQDDVAMLQGDSRNQKQPRQVRSNPRDPLNRTNPFPRPSGRRR